MPLATPRIGAGAYFLTLRDPDLAGEAIAAYVAGVRIGDAEIPPDAVLGDQIAISCNRFPCTPLPAEIRVARRGAPEDIAPALTVATEQEATRLVGPGALSDVTLSLSLGVIRGRCVNRVNGVRPPDLRCRINTRHDRPVTIGPAEALGDGGAAHTFSVALGIGDLGDAGLSVEIMEGPSETPLAVLNYRREDDAPILAQISAIQKRLDGLEQRSRLELNALRRSLGENVERQAAFNDRAFEYLASLVFDKAAGVAWQDLRHEIAASAEPAGGIEAPDVVDLPEAGPHVMITADRPHFADGWHWLERDPAGVRFRWMAETGTILNPYPERTLLAIRIAITNTIHDLVPELSATLDGAPADLAVLEDGPRWFVTVSPADPASAEFQFLALRSAVGRRPSEITGSEDTRLLSVAASSVAFRYAP